ncbi:MAG: enoyl-CoA hydratase-related protein [Pseudomonadota bacterium]|nr:enoyl-CoA hydratase-related protein [Pseudomonadota bacterium]
MHPPSPTVTCQLSGAIAQIRLNRAEVHNAFDDQLIAALINLLEQLAHDDAIRAIVLSGEGNSFSAGADLQWMRRMAAASEMDNRADAEKLARLMRTLAFFPKPTLARVNGVALGGGVGLIACCDIAIAVDSARFGLNEARLGLAPAVISPYVIDAIGARQARRWFQTAEQFDAAHALRINLVHEVVTADQLDATCDRVLKTLLANGPSAVGECKHLVDRIAGRSIEDQRIIDADNAALIARLRVSAEGQEGLSAFLEKRKAAYSL